MTGKQSGGGELGAEFIYPRRRRIQRGKQKHGDPTGLQPSLSMCLPASVSKYDLIKFEADSKSPVEGSIWGHVAASFVLELICVNVVFKEQLFTPHLSCPPPTVNKEGLLWSCAGSNTNTHACTQYLYCRIFSHERWRTLSVVGFIVPADLRGCHHYAATCLRKDFPFLLSFNPFSTLSNGLQSCRRSHIR